MSLIPVKKNIILMYGGRSQEHEISLLSAASVINALDKALYSIACLAGDKDGNWYLTPSEKIINDDPAQPLIIKNIDSQKVSLSTNLFQGVYAVLPIMHGSFFEDGRLQGFLDHADVAYIGSGHLASAMGMDKAVTKLIAASAGVKIAPYELLRKCYLNDKRDEIIERAVKTFGFPLFIKPVCLGSSVGIHRVNSLAELNLAIKDAFCYDNKVLIEQAVKGRELEVAVLKQQDNIMVSIAGEVCMVDIEDFYSYEAKYQNKVSAQLIMPASLSKEQLSQLQEAAKLTFEVLECDGLARVDFFLEEKTGKFILNEINSMPGVTQISMYPKLWQCSGIEYSQLLNKLIEQANWSYMQTTKLVRDYS